MAGQQLKTERRYLARNELSAVFFWEIFLEKWHEKTLYILYRDSSFRISISKRFRIKDLKYLVHFLWLKYSTSPRKMIVYSLNELLRFL